MTHHTSLYNHSMIVSWDENLKVSLKKVSLGALVAGVAAGAPAVVGTSVGVGGAAILSAASNLFTTTSVHAQVATPRAERFSILVAGSNTSALIGNGDANTGLIKQPSAGSFSENDSVTAGDFTNESVLYVLGSPTNTIVPGTAFDAGEVLRLSSVSSVGSSTQRWGTLRFGDRSWFHTSSRVSYLSETSATFINNVAASAEINVTPNASTAPAIYEALKQFSVIGDSNTAPTGTIYAESIELLAGQRINLSSEADLSPSGGDISQLNIFGDWSVIPIEGRGPAKIGINVNLADRGTVNLFASSISDAPDLQFGFELDADPQSIQSIVGDLAVRPESPSIRGTYELGDLTIHSGLVSINEAVEVSFLGDLTTKSVTFATVTVSGAGMLTAKPGRQTLSVIGGAANLGQVSFTSVGGSALNLEIAGNSEFSLQDDTLRFDGQNSSASIIGTSSARSLNIGLAKGQSSERKVTITGGDFGFADVSVGKGSRLVLSKDVNLPFLRGEDEVVITDSLTDYTFASPLAGVEFAFAARNQLNINAKLKVDFAGGGILDLGNRSVNLVLRSSTEKTFLTGGVATGADQNLDPFGNDITVRAANFKGYQILTASSTTGVSGAVASPNLDVNGAGVIDFSDRTLAGITYSLGSGNKLAITGSANIAYAGRLTSSGGGTVIVGSGISSVGALGSGGQNGFSNLVFAPAGNASTFTLTVGGDYSVGEIVYANSSTETLELTVGGTGAVITGNIAAPLASTDSTVEVTGGTLNADIGLTGGVIDTVTFTGDTTVNGAIFANSLVGAVNLTFDGARIPTVDTRIALTKVDAVTGPPMMPAMSGSVTTHGSVTFQSDSFAVPGGVTVDATGNQAGEDSGQFIAVVVESSAAGEVFIGGNLTYNGRPLTVEERKAGATFVTDVDVTLSATGVDEGTINIVGNLGSNGHHFRKVDVSASEFTTIGGSVYAETLNVQSGDIEFFSKGVDATIDADLVTEAGVTANFIANSITSTGTTTTASTTINRSVGASGQVGDLGVGGDGSVTFQNSVNARNLVVLDKSAAGMSLGTGVDVTFNEATSFEEIDLRDGPADITIRGEPETSGQTIATIGFVRVGDASDATLSFEVDEVDGASISATDISLGGIGAITTSETLFEDVEALITDPGSSTDQSIARLSLTSGGQRQEVHLRSTEVGQPLSARAITVGDVNSDDSAVLISGYNLFPNADVDVGDGSGLVFEDINVRHDGGTDLPEINGSGDDSYLGFIGSNTFVGALDIDVGISRQGSLTLTSDGNNNLATSSITGDHELIVENGASVVISEDAKLDVQGTLELQNGAILELTSRSFFDGDNTSFDLDSLVSGSGSVIAKEGSVIRVTLDTIPLVEELDRHPIDDITAEGRAKGEAASITKSPVILSGAASQGFVDAVTLDGVDGAFTGNFVYNEDELRTDLVLSWRGLETHLQGTNLAAAAETIDAIYLRADAAKDEVVTDASTSPGQDRIYRAYRELVREIYVEPRKLQNLMPVDARTETTGQAIAVAERSIELTSARLASLRYDRENVAGVATGDPRDGGLGFWAQTFFGSGSRDADGDIAGSSTDFVGFSFGGDTSFQSNVLVGGALSYASGTVKGKDSADGDKSENATVLLTGYGTVDFDNFFVDGALSLGRTSFDLTDKIDLLGVGDVASSTDGTQFGLKAIAGYKLPSAGAFQVTPKVSLSFQSISTTAYDQTIGQITRNVEASRNSYFSAGFGATVSREMRRGATILRPTGSVMLLLDFGRKAAEGSYKFTNLAIDNTNTIEGAAPTTSGFLVDLGVDALNVGGGWDVGGYYTGEFRSGNASHTLRVNARYAF